jgi:hypothetical protein
MKFSNHPFSKYGRIVFCAIILFVISSKELSAQQIPYDAVYIDRIESFQDCSATTQITVKNNRIRIKYFFTNLEYFKPLQLDRADCIFNFEEPDCYRYDLVFLSTLRALNFPDDSRKFNKQLIDSYKYFKPIPGISQMYRYNVTYTIKTISDGKSTTLSLPTISLICDAQYNYSEPLYKVYLLNESIDSLLLKMLPDDLTETRRKRLFHKPTIQGPELLREFKSGKDVWIKKMGQ